MKLRIFILLLSLVTSAKSLAVICHNFSNSITVVNYDLTTTLTKEENQQGKAVELIKSQDVGVEAICALHPDGDSRTYRSYRSPFPVIFTEDQWKYMSLDPTYIAGAMRITDSDIGDYYPPGDYIHMGKDWRVDQEDLNEPFPVYDSNLVFRIKIVKPFIGTVIIPNKVMFNVYVTTTNTDPLNTIVYQITYNGAVTVPQNCVINAGQVITVDLGKLNSSSFTTVGEKPYNAPVKTFNVPVECNADVISPAHLTLRLVATADTHVSQALATDNKDVGVVVTNENGTVMIPNDTSSVADFITDDKGHADVTLKTYPISTTGNAPAEGVFTALACLRIDFA
ncbi:fimbrial protein [Enterobacter sp. Acro-832]|uniref:fimbrial protein n=1 Tax=Enterobacter sp. Acro-832 TaxID=2608348 RepID=UPI00141E5BBD|nr:fimbrial protein [Enterobacter sp. Acro-832]